MSDNCSVIVVYNLRHTAAVKLAEVRPGIHVAPAGDGGVAQVQVPLGVLQALFFQLGDLFLALGVVKTHHNQFLLFLQASGFHVNYHLFLFRLSRQHIYLFSHLLYVF